MLTTDQEKADGFNSKFGKVCTSLKENPEANPIVVPDDAELNELTEDEQEQPPSELNLTVGVKIISVALASCP